MDDTSKEVKALQQAFWMSLPEPERFRRCGELFALAKQAAAERAPSHLSEEEKKWFVLRELYGAEFADIARRSVQEGIDDLEAGRHQEGSKVMSRLHGRLRKMKNKDG